MLQQLISKIQPYGCCANFELIAKAYSFAEAAHLGQVRSDGTPRLNHVVGVASLLTELKVDSYTIAAALLHDVLEYTDLAKKDLIDEFGETVASLVDGVTVVRHIKTKEGEIKEIDNVRKLLLATAKDVRVVLIRLAEELHNLQNLTQLPAAEREGVAKKAFSIYGPLAERLGVHHFKWQIEDWAFKRQNHPMHTLIQNDLAETREDREDYIQRAKAILHDRLTQEEIPTEIQGRPKHIYSIYKKMLFEKKPNEDEKEALERIYDKQAFRVITDSVENCYKALGITHSLWKPGPRFFDFIANPKPNGYQAIHTDVFCLNGKIASIHILTKAMYEYNEFGPAAHVFYKESGRGKGGKTAIPIDRIRWLKDLVEWQKEIQKDEEFVEALKIDVFGDRVFVFTPKGDLLDLPKGSTSVDFAYAVHTDLGHRCLGAKVNDKMVPLTYRLQNGEVCEILSAKKEKGPSVDWLIFVKTRLARHEIKKWLKKFR